MNHPLSTETLETAVRLKQGLGQYDLAQLNKFVGGIVMQLAEDSASLCGGAHLKEAVKNVAKEEFAKKHGKTQVSWVDYAEKYSDNVSENFCLESLSAMRVERL